MRSEGKRLQCLEKQLNYVWSVSELDKKKNLRSKKIAGIRGWIQAVATLLTNIHIPNLFKGKIYQGNAKAVCVPGLNCYSCPAATGACPIGAFQAVVGSSRFKFSYYITGILILFGCCWDGSSAVSSARSGGFRSFCTRFPLPSFPPKS